MKTRPTITILLPAYNGEPHLRETLDSVRNQTHTDFELLAINDGSRDNTLAILREYAKLDKRIVVVDQKNRGLVATLNRGIEQARGEYIARIDVDDPWFPRKLEWQMELFKKDKNLVLVGGSFEIIDSDGYYLETIFLPTTDDDIRRAMMLRNPFGHAGVVFRRDAAIKAGLYSDKFGPTEDYELWIRLAEMGALANVDRPVYRYRVNLNGISHSNSVAQARETKQHIARLWSRHTPRVLGRGELVAGAKRYLQSSSRPSFGVALKYQFLSDNARIGIKLIRYGHLLRGAYQLLCVASTGRSGLRAVLQRFAILIVGERR